MTFVVTTEPAEEPLTLAAFKDALRVTSSDLDQELTQLLTAARRQVEHDSSRRLVTQTVKLYLDTFPLGDVLQIRTAPVASVTSVTYIDTAGATQTFAASNYNADTSSTPSRIILKSGKYWPATEDRTPNAVTVEFQAGYGNAASVPAEAKLAILEFGKASWSGCDPDTSMAGYNGLIAKLRWTEYHDAT